MTTKKLLTYLSISLSLSVLITSCRKEDDNDTETGIAGDHALAEGSFNDVNNIADEASTGTLTSYLNPINSGERSITSACATITNDTTVNPRLLTIDFGSTNCPCSDGRNRRGIINVSYTGAYRDSGSVHTITFTNYFVNDNQLLGTKTVTNNGRNTTGNLVYSISVSGQIIKANGGGTITWTSARQREWVAGETTPQWNDDSYLITGTGNGTSASGNTFTANIVQALKRDIGCRYFVAGQVGITPNGKATRFINFGNGTCDNAATVTINGNVYNITLP
ncbi:MAG: hypothetical protein IT234_01940 [Bacteroidia bacterium]|nr:hypothetical protein [Bacteroidia bacterium]